MMTALSALALASAFVAQDPGPLVTTAWLADRLGDPSLVVLQIESRPDRFEAGRVPGARYIAFGDITVPGDPEVSTELPPLDQVARLLSAAGVTDDTHIVITSTSILGAARLWMTIDRLGHGDHASLLDGGIAKWRAEDRPIETGPPAAAPARAGQRLTVRPRENMLVNAEWIHARLDDPKIALVDARPDDEYTGEDGGMGGMAHPGHIPGARQMYYEKLLVPGDVPTLRPAVELRALFEEAGATDVRTVVAYCMIGMRASLTYFTARMLGYDVRFYDGSWHDWGTRDLPYVSGRNPR